MTLQEERDYWDKPGSFSRDIDRIRAQFIDASINHNMFPKVIVMGKAKVIESTPLGQKVYRVTFHHTWTREE